MKKFFLFFLLLPIICFSQTLSGISTFECIGLYGQNLANGKVQYREVNSTVWKIGLDLWQDARQVSNRPAGEWRGSIIGLKSGTSYEIQAGGASTTVTTWSESFPVGSTTTLNSPTTITQSGTPTAYRVYTGNISGGSNNLVINGSYIIIRGMNLSNATNDAIVLQQNCHDLIIENCDISGWGQSSSALGGNNQAGIRIQGFSYNAKNVSRIIIQRNKIHDPRFTASAWDAGSTHPYGVTAINFENAGENHVIRYNDIVGSYTDKSKRYVDGIMGADNFTFSGFPNANSDVYGNFVDQCYDDGLEIEGSNCNVRVWGNWMNNTFTGVATATTSVGPCYVWNNITNIGQRLVYGTSNSTLDNEDRGPFNKCGGNNDPSLTGGRTYLFHNTVLQPRQSGFANSRGLCGGIIDNGGKVTNVVSMNNIWTSAYTSKGGQPIAMWQGGNVSSTNDLLSPNTTQGSVTKTGTITSAPIYVSTIPLTLDPNGYFLASNSPGKGKAIRINNFNESDNADVGAYNGKQLEFGVNAYLNTPPPPPVNQPPVATASANPINVTLPTNSVNLSGTGTDSDGNIILYSWSEVSGKTNYSLGSPNSSTTTASNLIEGKYIFRLTVTDNKGATGFADVNVTVNPAPPDPTKVIPVYYDFIIHNSDSTVKTIRIKP